MRVSPKMPFSGALRGRRPRSSRALVYLATVLVVALVVTIVTHTASVPVSLAGSPRVVDGDSLDFGDERTRILGIDAPELDQTCLDAGGVSWPCGREAREELRAIIGGGQVACKGERRDRFRRLLVTCEGTGGDVAAAMVLAGMAVSSGQYGDEEAFARGRKAGLWSGTFEPPRSYRDRTAGFDPLAFILGWFGD